MTMKSPRVLATRQLFELVGQHIKLSDTEQIIIDRTHVGARFVDDSIGARSVR